MKIDHNTIFYASDDPTPEDVQAFLPVKKSHDNDVSRVESVVNSHVKKASSEIMAAVKLINAEPWNVSLGVFANGGNYGTGRCNVSDLVMLVVAALTIDDYWVERDGRLALANADKVSFRDDKTIKRAIGWFIDRIMWSLPQAPKWWSRLAEIRDERFHDGEKRHAMNVVAASLWCLGSRKYKEYDTSEYDFMQDAG